MRRFGAGQGHIAGAELGAAVVIDLHGRRRLVRDPPRNDLRGLLRAVVAPLGEVVVRPVLPAAQHLEGMAARNRKADRRPSMRKLVQHQRRNHSSDFDEQRKISLHRSWGRCRPSWPLQAAGSWLPCTIIAGKGNPASANRPYRMGHHLALCRRQGDQLDPPTRRRQRGAVGAAVGRQTR